MNHPIRVATVLALGVVGVSLGGASAAADRTGVITGLSACESTAQSYRNAGYTAYCILLQGEKYVVDYNKPSNSRPSTGSFG